jgi:phospholipase D1/2
LRVLLLIRTSSISNTGKEGPVKNQIAAALVEKIIGAARSGKKFKVSIFGPV